MASGQPRNALSDASCVAQPTKIRRNGAYGTLAVSSTVAHSHLRRLSVGYGENVRIRFHSLRQRLTCARTYHFGRIITGARISSDVPVFLVPVQSSSLADSRF